MRLSGDADGCADAARQLRRAAAEVARTAEAVQRAEVVGWSGAAAQGWERLSTRQVLRLREHVHSLTAAAAAVGRHAEELVGLQERARRLTAEAAEAGLLLDHRGDIAPVPLPEAATPELLRDVQHRREVRHRLLAAVDDVRAEQDRRHARLLGELHCGRPDSPAAADVQKAGSWLPSRWDVPAFVVSGTQAVDEVLRGLPPVLRSLVGSNVVGFGVGAAVDGFVHDLDVGDLVTKNTLVVGATVLATVAAGTVSAPVWVPVAAGAAAGYGAGRLFDAHGHRLPWVQHRPQRGAVRVRQSGAPPAVAVGDRSSRHVVHPRPASTARPS